MIVNPISAVTCSGASLAAPFKIFDATSTCHPLQPFQLPSAATVPEDFWLSLHKASNLISESFMQPRPSTIYQEHTTNSTIVDEPRDPAQYGSQDSNGGVSLRSADDAEAETGAAASAEQISADAALAAYLQDAHDAPIQSSGRLSTRSTSSPPSGRDRVSEYEQASTPPIKKKHGPAFEVIKSHRSPHDKSSPIQELPNGW